jgi:alpha-beta hydrolase superfamily lysophospholipase
MVSARAGRWLRRVLAGGLVLVVLLAAGATWAYSGQIGGLMLKAEHGLPSYDVEVLAVGGGEVTLPAGAGEPLGTWGLEWETGYARVGPVAAVGEDGVVRPVLEAAGDLRAGLLVALDPYAFEADPASLGLAFDNVIVEGPLGNYPAWHTPGTDDTWVILVHDRDSYRREALRVLRTLATAGFHTLTITYRNDPGAPDGGGRYGLGDPEWEDVEAAVRYAADEGAGDVVLYGWGMGGATAAMFLHESSEARLVAGLVLDAPLLDPAAVVDLDAAGHNIPGFLAGWAKGLATLRWGTEWGRLNQVARADDFEVPILLFHGDADAEIPVASSDAFAAALPELVRYERFAGAGHGACWNADPARYEAALAAFMDEVAAGPAEPRLPASTGG